MTLICLTTEMRVNLSVVIVVSCCSDCKPTRVNPWFVVAQLSTAVRTTRVHTPIMQQEQ